MDKEVTLSEDLLVALDKRVATLRFAGYDGMFVEAEEPGVKEGEIHRAAMGVQARGGRNAKDTDDIEVSIGMNPYAAFIAKCECQIVDFCLPCATGEATTSKRFEPKNNGRNRSNTEVYQGLQRTHGVKEAIEGFLDEVAGRDTDSAADFEALKGGQ